MVNEIYTTANTGFASGGVTSKLGALCFYSGSVQVDSFVLRNPPERKARKRCGNIQISMTENGDPLENAIAERVNGILKEEYLNNYEVENYSQAKELLDAVIRIYNNERPHMSIGYITPEKVHSKELKKGDCKWKNYYKKKEVVNIF